MWIAVVDFWSLLLYILNFFIPMWAMNLRISSLLFWGIEWYGAWSTEGRLFVDTPGKKGWCERDVRWKVGPTNCSRVKHLDSYWIDCHDALNTPKFSHSTNIRLTFLFLVKSLGNYGWIAMKVGTNIQGPQKVNPYYFGVSLTFPEALPAGLN